MILFGADYALAAASFPKIGMFHNTFHDGHIRDFSYTGQDPILVSSAMEHGSLSRILLVLRLHSHW